MTDAFSPTDRTTPFSIDMPQREPKGSSRSFLAASWLREIPCAPLAKKLQQPKRDLDKLSRLTKRVSADPNVAMGPASRRSAICSPWWNPGRAHPATQCPASSPAEQYGELPKRSASSRLSMKRGGDRSRRLARIDQLPRVDTRKRMTGHVAHIVQASLLAGQTDALHRLNCGRDFTDRQTLFWRLPRVVRSAISWPELYAINASTRAGSAVISHAGILTRSM